MTMQKTKYNLDSLCVKRTDYSLDCNTAIKGFEICEQLNNRILNVTVRKWNEIKKKKTNVGSENS